MGEEWKPIRLYDYLGNSKPGIFVTRAQIVAYLKDTQPDRIESAGNSYVKAAGLVHGKSGLEGTLLKAAEELAEVWRGEGATTALEALRLLHASAAALGDAMEKTGKPMVEYAQQLRTSKTTMPGPTALSTTTNVDNEPTTNFNPQLGTAGYLVDSAARAHLEQLNNKINELNAQLADGLAFKLPEIQPMVVETQKQQPLDPGSGTKTPSGETRYWTGDGSKGSSGSDGSSTGGGRDGSDGTDGKGDQNPGKDQDPGRDDPGQDPGKGQDDPSTGTQDPNNPQQPGNGPGTGGSPQKPGDQDQSVPPVIGADQPKTQLADAGNPNFPTTTTTPQTTGYPQQSTPTVLTNPTTQVPTSTPFSPVPGQSGGGPSTWYGAGGSASGAAPSVLRGGPGASGTGLMAYPPGGMGAGGDQSSERNREIYDPEGDIWSSAHQAGPDRIG